LKRVILFASCVSVLITFLILGRDLYESARLSHSFVETKATVTAHALHRELDYQFVFYGHEFRGHDIVPSSRVPEVGATIPVFVNPAAPSISRLSDPSQVLHESLGLAGGVLLLSFCGLIIVGRYILRLQSGQIKAT